MTTTFTYDVEDLLREFGGATTLKYVHGPGIDEPLATDDGSTFLYFQTDSLGSVVKTTSSAGSVTLTRQYDAWGNLQAGAVNGYAFTGREWDSEIGLAHYRARYFDPRSGRFLGEDPIRWGAVLDGPVFNIARFLGDNPAVADELATPPIELNPYSYVANNPANFVDPFGLQACLIIGRVPPIIMWQRPSPTWRLAPNQTYHPPTRPPKVTPPPERLLPRLPPPTLPPPTLDPTPTQLVPRMPWWWKILHPLTPWGGDGPMVPVAPTDDCGCIA